MTDLNLTLQVWRQPGPSAPGRLVRYEARDISPDMGNQVCPSSWVVTL